MKDYMCELIIDGEVVMTAVFEAENKNDVEEYFKTYLSEHFNYEISSYDIIKVTEKC